MGEGRDFTALSGLVDVVTNLSLSRSYEQTPVERNLLLFYLIQILNSFFLCCYTFKAIQLNLRNLPFLQTDFNFFA